MVKKLLPQYVSELICTRISHDLIGNIGAVANAVELMDDDAESLNDVKPILEVSSQTLTSRLKFFRLAFGLKNTDIKDINDIRTIAEKYLSTIGSRTSPINLLWMVHTPQLYKIVLLGIMIMADVFIRGGELSVCEDNNGLEIKAASPSPLSVGKLATLQKVTEGIVPEENPAQSAPLFYLMSLLDGSNINISLKYDNNSAILQIA